MEKVKWIVCLANSRKVNGRCVAGKEVISRRPGQWIRPVSQRDTQEVSERERQYIDGTEPVVLDVVEIAFLRHVPNSYQKENWLIDSGGCWKRIARVNWSQLYKLADKLELLWADGHSTYHGLNDKVPLYKAKWLQESLRLVHVESLQLSVFAPGEAFGNSKRRVQARFRYNATDYRLWVTDPRFEREFLSKPDGKHELPESYLTISLGEAYEDAAYKLVAAIMPRPETS